MRSTSDKQRALMGSVAMLPLKTKLNLLPDGSVMLACSASEGELLATFRCIHDGSDITRRQAVQSALKQAD